MENPLFMSQVVQDPAEAGREAVQRHAWQEGFDLFKQADGAGVLSGDDLEVFAEAALWSAGFDEFIPLMERAYAAHTRAGNKTRAAFVAIHLAHDYNLRLEKSVANGWLRGAQRLLEDEDEAPEHGYLALELGLRALSEHDFDRALAEARRAEEIGRRFGDRALEIRGIQRQGSALIEKGDLEEGRALLDEASVAAVSGELDPYSTIVVYCNTIGACRDVGDFDRAGEWTERASQFCDSHSLSAFPGMCRVNRVEVMRFRGELLDARDEADRAGRELRTWNPRVAGAAFYEIGEIRLRLGELAQAEQAFREADEFGKDPEPGRSLLLLAKGNVQGAAASIGRALGDDALGFPARARLLPAAVEIRLAAGDVDGADEAAVGLKEIADAYQTSALKAAAAHARGAVLLGREDAAGAMAPLRQAVRLWQGIGAMHETARSRELLGLALRDEGDEEAALWELQAAAARFERLGAVRDADRVAEALARASERETMKTFLFTDIVRSTDLLAAMEDRHWANLIRRHDTELRSVLERHGGQIVDHTGDGYFAAFDESADAVGAGGGAEQTCERQVPFDVRIGLHSDGALTKDENYRGRGVHTAARIGSAATGGEILASHATMKALPQFPTSNARDVALKGVKEPVPVCSVDWRG
jgi:class 3 adenylate cyclase